MAGSSARVRETTPIIPFHRRRDLARSIRLLNTPTATAMRSSADLSTTARSFPRSTSTFGDLGTSGIGRIFYMDAAGGTISEFNYDLTSGGVAPSQPLFSFGEDASGELYGLFGNGDIVKFVPEPIGLSVLVLLLPLMRRR